MALFHFSDDPTIARFDPRPVQVPAERAPGMDWLNGPLVWAIDAPRQAMYSFPRDCPRILIWAEPGSAEADIDRWMGPGRPAMVAYVEWAWFERLKTGVIHRYALPAESFESLRDAGMWVSRQAVTPDAVETLTDLPAALAALGVELRLMESLLPLKDVWSSSLHASGIRLRNAQGWVAAGQPLRAAGR
ncbi:DUF6886 family protein [Phenylobacterium aquaticum]|uniref:DUF6886 family protein n=1 Tax=Phenylobacterium aquaticum TaxID=1763816 RepID=UPI001F5DFE05|nr:DUF6886 family protein [Phenylobacterium aquaticum]MCI3134039.1 hypothetical protein [Phenylobacterium aquaticum]